MYYIVSKDINGVIEFSPLVAQNGKVMEDASTILVAQNTANRLDNDFNKIVEYMRAEGIIQKTDRCLNELSFPNLTNAEIDEEIEKCRLNNMR